MTLLTSLRSEMLKNKRTAALYLALAGGAIEPLISLLDFLTDGIPKEDQQVLLQKMFTSRFQMTGFFFLPMFLILACTLLAQIEYKNNAWKQVFAAPQSRSQLFLAKFFNVHLLILIFIVTNQLLTLLTAVILHVLHPTIQLLHQPVNFTEIWLTVSNSYLVLLAVGAIQFWMSLRFKNFIIPIALGVSLWVIGSLLVMEGKKDWAVYFPYSFQVYTTFPKYKAQLPVARWASVSYCALFLIIGLTDFKRKE